MDSQSFINSFSIHKLKFSKKHSVARIITFNHPCIGYLIKGKGEFLYQGKTFTVKEGDLIYIADETSYYSVWTGFPDIEFYALDFSFNNKLAYLDYRFQIVENYPSDILDSIYNDKDSDFLMSVSEVYKLLSDIYGKMEKSCYSPKYSKIKPAISYIEEHYTENISIEHLAKLCNYSQSHFYSIFRELTGVTPIAYKHNILMQNALKLLSQTDSTIEQISASLGFSSPGYFRKIFYNTFGKTPKELR